MATTAVFGSIAEFNADYESFTEWVERLEQWFIVNLIANIDRKKALFLSLARGYKLICSLSQNDPTSKTYEELTRIMREHLQPTPNEIAQRYVFYKRDRLVGESIKDYVAELRKLSEHCNFADRLEESIRDKLVCGLNDQKIQQKLLAVRNLTLQSAMDTAVAMESAAKNARDLYGGVRGVKNEVGVYSGGNSGGGVNRLDKRSYKGYGNVSVSKKECFRCGGIKHDSDHCTFKSRECFGCKKVGHGKQLCPSLKKDFSG